MTSADASNLWNSLPAESVGALSPRRHLRSSEGRGGSVTALVIHHQANDLVSAATLDQAEGSTSTNLKKIYFGGRR